MLVACAAAPVAPKPIAHDAVDAASAEDASSDATAKTSAPPAMNCDPPRVRDTVTLACTDHAPCATGEDLVSGACVPSCGPPFTTRDDKGGCTCAPGLVDVRGGEFGGCVKPHELDFSKMCKARHQHFEGALGPTCKCDAGYVPHASGANLGLGGLDECVRPCNAPLAYDSVTDRCSTCAPDREKVGEVCVDKCPPDTRRDASSGECVCVVRGMFLYDGKCAYCTGSRVFDPATRNCECPAGTEDWGYTDGCLATCPAGKHRLHQRCVADCSGGESNDDKTGACGPCDPSRNAFVTTLHGHTICTRCSFDEVLGKNGECECRPGFRQANNHCVHP